MQFRENQNALHPALHVALPVEPATPARNVAEAVSKTGLPGLEGPPKVTRRHTTF